MSGNLTTHVLDTAAGRPAAGVAVTLSRIGEAGAERLLATRTNAEGRTEEPLLSGSDFAVGAYELVFDLGAYFAASSVAPADPPFLGEVPVRFAIADPEGKYHVPLLASPWSYATYRGS